MINGAPGSLGLSLFNGDSLWTQNSNGILGGSESGDQFGAALVGSPKLGPGGPGFSGLWGEIRLEVLHQGKKKSSKIDAELVVFNPGGEMAADSVINVYISDDEIFDSNDVLVQTVKRFRELKPGESRIERIKFKTKDVDASGMRLIAILDATNVVDEANEANNTIVSDPLQTDFGQFASWLVDSIRSFGTETMLGD